MRSAVLRVVAAVVLASGCAASAKPEERVAALDFTPAAGMARVYVYRTSSLMGALSATTIFSDTLLAGMLDPETFLMFEVKPGPHRVEARGQESQKGIVFEALSDSVYFFKVWPKMGFFGARAGMEQVNPVEGRRAVQNARMVESLLPKQVS